MKNVDRYAVASVDATSWVTVFDCRRYITAGNRYEIVADNGRSFCFVDDLGRMRVGTWPPGECIHLGRNGYWRLVVVADMSVTRAENDDEKTQIQEMRDEITDLKAKLARSNKMLTDSAYQIAVLVDLLGPIARRVWDRWQANKVTRVHFAWGPDASDLDGEQRAKIIEEFEAAPRRLITNVDEEFHDLTGQFDDKV